MHHAQHAIVDTCFKAHVGTAEAKPAWNDPIEMRQGSLQRGITVVVPAGIEADADSPVLGDGERGRHPPPFEFTSLRVAHAEFSFVLAQFFGEPGCVSQRFRIGGTCDREAMCGRAGRRPGAADRCVRLRSRPRLPVGSKKIGFPVMEIERAKKT